LPRTSLTLTPAALGALLFVAACAQAQDAQTAPATEPAIATVVVSASADASAQGLSAAYAGGQVARGGRLGLLGNVDIMDTPFNATNYTQALIQDQQARSVGDVVQNDPSVRVARGFGNFQELYVIRGFAVNSDDLAYNGLYGLLPRQFVASELLERVEILRGANSFVNGAAPGGGGIGGAVNLVPKRARTALNQVTLGVESGGQAYGAFDVARRFGEGDRAGIRVNAVHRRATPPSTANRAS
jgi:iron complex outermembrane receptor protein